MRSTLSSPVSHPLVNLLILCSMGRKPVEMHANVILSRAVYSGLAALVRPLLILKVS
jgi:hypothetical protein